MAEAASKKEQTLRRMTAAASRGFRRYGFAGVGVDGIARAAGVTSGAFYAHFGSKDGAFTAAMALGLSEVIANIPLFQRDHGDRWVAEFADYYLGAAHRADLAGGCAMTSLSPEVVRAGADVHGAYEEKMTRIAEIIAAGLAGDDEADRLGRAWAMLGVLIGGLTLARAVQSAALAETIARAVRAAAVAAAGAVA